MITAYPHKVEKEKGKEDNPTDKDKEIDCRKSLCKIFLQINRKTKKEKLLSVEKVGLMNIR